MPISCHFRDCKALLVTSLTNVSGAITNVQTFTFTFTVPQKWDSRNLELGTWKRDKTHCCHIAKIHQTLIKVQSHKIIITKQKETKRKWQTLHNKYSAANNGVTLKSGLGVVYGCWKLRCSIEYRAYTTNYWSATVQCESQNFIPPRTHCCNGNATIHIIGLMVMAI